MKVLDIQTTSLDACVSDAQSERIVIARDGNPVAVVLGVQGLDEEQVALGSSDEFWELIARRRREKTLTRGALEKRGDEDAARRSPDVE